MQCGRFIQAGSEFNVTIRTPPPLWGAPLDAWIGPWQIARFFDAALLRLRRHPQCRPESFQRLSKGYLLYSVAGGF